MPPTGKAPWDNSRTSSKFSTHRTKQYQCCLNKKCNGWEWCSNHRTNCRICNSKLEPPPEEYDKQKQQARKSSRGKSPHSPRPRRDRVREKVEQNDSAASSDPNAGLLPLFQARLPELRQSFPDLAKSLEEAVKPVQVSPAAALHGAQSQCQQAFKQVVAAEQVAIDLEYEASDMVTNLRAKVRELHDAQKDLVAARDNYDVKAKAAQIEVQKSVSQPEASHVTALVHELGHEDLLRVAKSLEEAAEKKRKEQVVQELVEEVSKVENKPKKPLPQPLAPQDDGPPGDNGTVNADAGQHVVPPGLPPPDVEMPPQNSQAAGETADANLPPIDVGAAQAALQKLADAYPPPKDPNEKMSPVNAGDGLAEGQEQSGAAASSDLRPASVPVRQRSRSPRDSAVRAASEAAADVTQPEQKKSKLHASDAADGTSEFLGPLHFEGIANQMEHQLKSFGVQTRAASLQGANA
jgi:phosphoribosylformylglycinamidine (FGAM) synthase PurS component